MWETPPHLNNLAKNWGVKAFLIKGLLFLPLPATFTHIPALSIICNSIWPHTQLMLTFVQVYGSGPSTHHGSPPLQLGGSFSLAPCRLEV